MPIHLRAGPGDYADAVLLPGDPLRAQYIAETFFDEPRLVNRERGLLGFTGRYRGRPVSVQSTGMGGPSAAIVVEELIMLGARRLVRVGTAGALQPWLCMGDLVIAMSATPADRTVSSYTGGEPHAPTADFELLAAAKLHAGRAGHPARVGAVVSSDLFYNPDPRQAERWAQRGGLAVEMETAALFTVAALRGARAASLLTITDVPSGATMARITDLALTRAVDAMAEVALETATGELEPR